MTAAPIRLLLIEDNPGDARLVQEALADRAPGEFAVSTVDRLADALMRIQSERFDVVLCDLGLPDSVGPGTAQAIVARAPAVPLVVLTEINDKDIGRVAIQHGVQDYLEKGEANGRLIARTLHYAIERKRLEIELRLANEAPERRVSEGTARLLAANRITGFIRDISERNNHELKIMRLNRILAVQSGISNVIMRVRDREELFNEACRIAVNHGNFEVVWIGALDAATQDVTAVAWTGENAEQLTRIKRSARDDTLRGTGAVGRAIRERRLVFNNDIVAQATHGPHLKEVLGLGFRSQITLPLFEEQTVVAVLMMYAREPNYFDEDERSLLSGLAGNISFALAHIAHQEKIARLSRIQALMSGINAMIVRVRGRQQLFDETCHIAVEQGGFGIAWIGILDLKNLEIRPAASAGMESDFLQRHKSSTNPDSPQGQGCLGRAIRENRAVFENDLSTVPGVGGERRKEAIRRGYGSGITLPLHLDGAVTGCLTLITRERNFFTADEVNLLTDVTRNISFSLDHLARQQQLEKMTRIRSLSSEINALIVRVSDRQKLLEEACRIAVERGGFGIAWIGMLDQNTMEIIPRAFAGIEAQSLAATSRNTARPDTPLGQGTVGRAIRAKRPVFSNDLAAETTPRGARRQEALRRGYRSYIALPLVVEDKAVGILALFAGETDFFTDEEVGLLNELAGNISFALSLMQKSEALTGSEKKLDNILGTLREVVWSMDPRSGRILYVNAAAESLARRPAADFLGQRRLWRRMVHRDDLASVHSAIRRLMQDGTLNHEFRIVLADGEVRTVESSARVRRDESGSSVRIDGIISDITNRRRLDAERAQLSAIVASSQDGIVSTAPDGTILTWNAGAEKMFGYSSWEVIGRNMILLVPDDLRQEVLQNRQRHRSGSGIDVYESERLTKDQRRLAVSVNASALRDASHKITGIAIIFRDISERKRAEAVLRDSRVRLQDLSQRLIELEDNVRRTINRELHDRVGANLAILALNISIVRSQLLPQSLLAIGARLDGMQRQIEDTTMHVRDLMAELHPPALDDFGLQAALRNYAQTLGAQLGMPIILRGELFVSQLPPMVETALFRVAQGALVNAVRHAHARHIEILFAESPHRITLTIADDGIGFDPARASPGVARWGIAIMRERAQAVGAELILDSMPGKGTRVSVWISREMCQAPVGLKS